MVIMILLLSFLTAFYIYANTLSISLLELSKYIAQGRSPERAPDWGKNSTVTYDSSWPGGESEANAFAVQFFYEHGNRLTSSKYYNGVLQKNPLLLFVDVLIALLVIYSYINASQPLVGVLKGTLLGALAKRNKAKYLETFLSHLRRFSFKDAAELRGRLEKEYGICLPESFNYNNFDARYCQPFRWKLERGNFMIGMARRNERGYITRLDKVKIYLKKRYLFDTFSGPLQGRISLKLAFISVLLSQALTRLGLCWSQFNDLPGEQSKEDISAWGIGQVMAIILLFNQLLSWLQSYYDVQSKIENATDFHGPVKSTDELLPPVAPSDSDLATPNNAAIWGKEPYTLADFHRSTEFRNWGIQILAGQLGFAILMTVFQISTSKGIHQLEYISLPITCLLIFRHLLHVNRPDPIGYFDWKMDTLRKAHEKENETEQRLERYRQALGYSPLDWNQRIKEARRRNPELFAHSTGFTPATEFLAALDELHISLEAQLIDVSDMRGKDIREMDM
ncbi:hypothetical protein BJ508DRAFT_103866 [Ascobolus immersus RN42]|uniref:Uncharacterized protein n=1 Tax=Ascobolus immersus RN42 TaxID=1160509 RepID=A0A3N4H8Z6_ASCIM|nr:hypothetical protein BJ508DRAFT_103866 [Ascobolus immersus RN42]